jgi:hypothetical protein
MTVDPVFRHAVGGGCGCANWRQLGRIEKLLRVAGCARGWCE